MWPKWFGNNMVLNETNNASLDPIIRSVKDCVELCEQRDVGNLPTATTAIAVSTSVSVFQLQMFTMREMSRKM